MIKMGVLLKWILGILFGLGAVTTMAYYAYPNFASSINNYPQSIFQYWWKKPKAPQIVDQKKEGGCGARVWWVDNALDEDGVYFYRRVVGEPDFAKIQITGPHAGIPGSFDDSNLPVGTYEYRVSVFNEYGESFSNISAQIAITNQACGNDPLPIKPLNPLITAIEIVKNTCTVRIYYQDNSSDEDGIRLYRESWVDNQAVIAELGPHNGLTDSYDDPDLPPGHYMYQVSVFNQNGESFSNHSDEVEITESTCDQLAINPNPPVLLPSSTPAVPDVAYTPTPQACIWKAAINVFVRKGPGASLYSEITAVEAGTMLPVVGQSEDENFWAVQLQPEVVGYVPKAERFGKASGDCNVPVLPDPEPPKQPLPGGGNQVPQCNDGIDNDGDRLIDMRDRGCTGPEDTSE